MMCYHHIVHDAELSSLWGRSPHHCLMAEGDGMQSGMKNRDGLIENVHV